ncbi:hypothetical protein COCON_G00130910 [Conger conger]|uniref:Translocating chain-associated membrane protein n=1 Tax=Conger conger TaxID=82655 RepID=A0A9Q1DDY0_CONCO|nr:translocating chain-associated membrane protein 1-like isoform X2 [Conger conger]KAJ8267919.1 hypothetical protein COCON_G00130910 [Conger conger]
MGIRKKNKNPPILSHEFIIQNHADIVSCLALLLVLGLLFEVTSHVAGLFITVQHNVTISTNEGQEELAVNYFHHGPKDMATVFFYMLIAIIFHAVIQECLLDKINRKMHLSKIKHTKFDESGQLSAFYLLSCGWGISILLSENLMSSPVNLWEGYPHTLMPRFQMKFFYISQLAYWLHALPELYFQKAKNEDIPRQLLYISLYLVHIGGAYILNLNRLGLVLMVLHYFVELLFHVSRLIYFSNESRQAGFTVWAVLFVIGRLLTLSLSVLTVGFGLAGAEHQGPDLTTGNFNMPLIRVAVLAGICATQAFMVWTFINVQLRRWREFQQQLRKSAPPRSSRPRRDRGGPNAINGALGNVPDSPRTRKEKSS